MKRPPFWPAVKVFGWLVLMIMGITVLVEAHANRKVAPSASVPPSPSPARISPNSSSLQVPKPSAPQDETKPRTPAKPRSKEDQPQQSAIIPESSPNPLSPSQPTYQQQCTTGSQCNTATGGGTINNPVVNNYKDPPPRVLDVKIRPLEAVPRFEGLPGETGSDRLMRIHRYRESLGFEAGLADAAVLPGLSISFRISAPFSARFSGHL